MLLLSAQAAEARALGAARGCTLTSTAIGAGWRGGNAGGRAGDTITPGMVSVAEDERLLAMRELNTGGLGGRASSRTRSSATTHSSAPPYEASTGLWMRAEVVIGSRAVVIAVRAGARVAATARAGRRLTGGRDLWHVDARGLAVARDAPVRRWFPLAARDVALILSKSTLLSTVDRAPTSPVSGSPS